MHIRFRVLPSSWYASVEVTTMMLRMIASILCIAPSAHISEKIDHDRSKNYCVNFFVFCIFFPAEGAGREKNKS